jgi:DNA repair exonuclease SbcCD nuclease subunit
MGEFAEQMIPDSYFGMGFDYVALGHYHKFTKVQERVYYAGSTERISFNEIGQEKGFLEIELFKDNSAPANLTPKFHAVPAREMIDLPVLDASGLDQNQIEELLQKRFSIPDLEEKILRLKIINLPEYLYHLLPFKKLTQWKNKAFFCDLRIEVIQESGEISTKSANIGRLNEEFLEYIKSVPVEGIDKNKLSELGLTYINQVLEEVE